MTKLGKWLVVINAGLSLMFLAWSYGLYSQRMPFQDYESSDGTKVKGISNELSDELKGLAVAREQADARWTDGTTKVTALETDIKTRRTYYDNQIAIAMTGKDAAGKAVTPPVATLKYNAGLIVLTGRDAFKLDGRDALSFDGYKSKIAEQSLDIHDTNVKTAAVATEMTVITKQIAGIKPYAEAITAVEKGLRGELIDAEIAKKNAILEERYLMTPVTNFTVELELLKRREAALKERLKELSASVVAR